MSEKKPLYVIEREKREKAKADLIKKMSPEQMQAAHELLTNAWDVLQTIGECQDLWMSQVRELETSIWKFQNTVYDRDDKRPT